MSDIVERVARAMALQANDYDGPVLQWQCWVDSAKAALAAMQTDAEPVAYWYKHPTQMDAEPFGTVRLTPADKADGWTETPLYAHPPIAAKDAEIAALKDAWQKQFDEKVKERDEAKLWFEKAQEWRQSLAALQAHADALAVELQQIEVDAMEHYNDWMEHGCEKAEATRFAFDLGECARKALRAYEGFRRD